MQKKPSEAKSDCVACTTKILGDKWTPRIIFVLSQNNLRFGEIQEKAGSINPRTLSQRLAGLEQGKIIKKIVYQEIPPHTEYMLTDKGRDLLPILKSMIDWGKKYG